MVITEQLLSSYQVSPTQRALVIHSWTDGVTSKQKEV